MGGWECIPSQHGSAGTLHFKTLISVLLGIYPEMKLLDDIAVLF